MSALPHPATHAVADRAPSRPGRVLLARAGAMAGSAGLAVLGVALLVGLWWLVAASTDPVRLPDPPAVLDAIRADWSTIPALQFVAFQSGGIAEALRWTTVNVVVGVAVGSGAGFVVGAVLGSSRVLRELAHVPMLLLGTVPVLVLLPFLLTWFGTARFVQSGLVIAFAFVTVSAVVQRATIDVGAAYSGYAATLGAGRSRLVRSVLLPAALPPAVGAVRVAAAAGWGFETVAELLGGQDGIGKLIQAMQGLSATADIMAAVLCVGVAGLILDAAIAALGGWVVRWKE